MSVFSGKVVSETVHNTGLNGVTVMFYTPQFEGYGPEKTHVPVAVAGYDCVYTGETPTYTPKGAGHVGEWSITDALLLDEDHLIYSAGATEEVTVDDFDYDMFKNSPRVYKFRHGTDVASNVVILSEPCVCLTVVGFDYAGNPMRWGDYQALGGDFNSILSWDSNGNHIPTPIAYVNIHGETGHEEASQKFPCLVFPVTGATPMAYIQLGQWPVRDGDGNVKGVLQERCVAPTAPLSSGVVYLNEGIAKYYIHSVADARKASYSSGAQSTIAGLVSSVDSLAGATPADRAANADGLLFTATCLVENQEYALVPARINSARKGTLNVSVTDTSGANVQNFTVTANQRRFGRDYKFGVFPGTGGTDLPQSVVDKCNTIGFDMAVFMPSSLWTRFAMNGRPTPLPDPTLWPPVFDETGWLTDMTAPGMQAKVAGQYGWDLFKRAGYWVKAHGMAFLYKYVVAWTIMQSSTSSAFVQAIKDYVTNFLAAFPSTFDVMETLNEPYTNSYGLSETELREVLTFNAARMKAMQTPPETLVNAALYGIPDPWTVCYLDTHQPAAERQPSLLSFLRNTDLTNVNDISLEEYFASQLDWRVWGIAKKMGGPCRTPSEIYYDINEVATAYPTKRINISESANPVTHAVDDLNGWWDDLHATAPYTQNFDPTTAVDFNRKLLEFAFAHPKNHSFVWWELWHSWSTSGLQNASLFDDNGNITPLGTMWIDFISAHTTHDTVTASAGVAAVTGYGGDYDYTITLQDGTQLSGVFHVSEQATNTLTISQQAAATDLSAFRQRIVEDSGDYELVSRNPATGLPDYTIDVKCDRFINDALRMLSDMPNADWLFEEEVSVEYPVAAGTTIIATPNLKAASRVIVQCVGGHPHDLKRIDPALVRSYSGIDHRHLLYGCFWQTALTANGKSTPAIQIGEAYEHAVTLTVIGQFTPELLGGNVNTNFVIQNYPLILEYATMHIWESKQRNTEGAKGWLDLLNEHLELAYTKRIATQYHGQAAIWRRRG